MTFLIWKLIANAIHKYQFGDFFIHKADWDFCCHFGLRGGPGCLCWNCELNIWEMEENLSKEPIVWVGRRLVAVLLNRRWRLLKDRISDSTFLVLRDYRIIDRIWIDSNFLFDQ